MKTCLVPSPSRYTSWPAYGQSKLANILHAKELTKQLKEDGVNITANALHPGVIQTNLFRHNNLINGNQVIKGLVSVLGKALMKNVQQGAATTCYVALHPEVKGVSGEYFADSNVKKPRPQAEDQVLAKKLWEFSKDLTK